MIYSILRRAGVLTAVLLISSAFLGLFVTLVLALTLLADGEFWWLPLWVLAASVGKEAWDRLRIWRWLDRNL